MFILIIESIVNLVINLVVPHIMRDNLWYLRFSEFLSLSTSVIEWLAEFFFLKFPNLNLFQRHWFFLYILISVFLFSVFFWSFWTWKRILIILFFCESSVFFLQIFQFRRLIGWYLASFDNFLGFFLTKLFNLIDLDLLILWMKYFLTQLILSQFWVFCINDLNLNVEFFDPCFWTIKTDISFRLVLNNHLFPFLLIQTIHLTFNFFSVSWGLFLWNAIFLLRFFKKLALSWLLLNNHLEPFIEKTSISLVFLLISFWFFWFPVLLVLNGWSFFFLSMNFPTIIFNLQINLIFTNLNVIWVIQIYIIGQILWWLGISLFFSLIFPPIVVFVVLI